MKNLLFVLCLVVSTTLFYSCGDDEKDDDPQITDEVTIVQNTVKGKYYSVGIEAYNFNDKTVDVWSQIINDGEYYQYANVPYKVYTEKQYIVIGTSPETLIYYEVVNNKVYLYSDSNKQTILTDSKKPDDMENESKEPNKDAIILSLNTHYTEFNTTEWMADGLRIMYVKDKKTDETILTFNWYRYNDIPQIGRVDVKDRGNLFEYVNGSLYLRDVKDPKDNMYAFNLTTKNEVKVLWTEQSAKNREYTTTLSVNLEGKYVGQIGISYYK